MAIKKWTTVKSWEDLPQVISVNELMQLMRICETTALKYLKEGKIPAAKAGKTWMIDKDAVKEFLKGGNAA